MLLTEAGKLTFQQPFAQSTFLQYFLIGMFISVKHEARFFVDTVNHALKA